MRGYKIIKEENNKWHFELFPPNNNKQPIGQSKSCDSKIDCLHLLSEFRNLVKEHSIQTFDSSSCIVSKTLNGYYVQYINEQEPIYKSREYTGKSAKNNCKKNLNAIYKYIDEYTLKCIK